MLNIRTSPGYPKAKRETPAEQSANKKKQREEKQKVEKKLKLTAPSKRNKEAKQRG